MQAIREVCGQAERHPGSGTDQSADGAGLRSIVVHPYPYVVFYRIAAPEDAFSVEIVRILHQRRDIEQALRENES